MAIFSPFPGVNTSVIADSACPVILSMLSNPTIVVAFDQLFSVLASAPSESAMFHQACDR